MMSEGILLDAHIWILIVSGDHSLSKKTIRFIENSATDGKIFLSTISTWEVAMLDMKKRITLGCPCLDWIEKSLSLSGIQLLPLTPHIAVESSQLPGEFHGDPADRVITATARIENITLVTKDKKMIHYGKKKYVKIYPG